MAQIASRGGGTPFGSGLVTVAELLSRSDPPAAPTESEPLTEAISVGSLLRREGLAPHSLHRPLQPCAGTDTDADADRWDDDRATDVIRRTTRASGRRSLVRRGALAAGAMVAVGSVFGAAAVSESTTSQAGPLPSEEYPGQGALDAGAPAAPVTTLGTAAQSSTLDSGTPAPTSWMKVGFPGVVPGGTTTPSHTTPPATHSARSTGTPAPAARTGSTTANTPSSTTGSGPTTTLGGTVGDVGKGTPLGGVTGPVGDTVSQLDDTTKGSTPERSRSSNDDSGSGSSSPSGSLVTTVTNVLGGLL